MAVARMRLTSGGERAPRGCCSSVAAGDDLIERISRLGELHEAGILTDAEFAARKAELLRRL